MSSDSHFEHIADVFSTLRGICKERNSDVDKGFESAFSQLNPIGLDQSITDGKSETNVSKNRSRSIQFGKAVFSSRPFGLFLYRYINILPYNNTRVKLSLADGRDYINASWCNGEQRTNQYIATQGPVPSSFEEFWWLIWSYQVSSAGATQLSNRFHLVPSCRYRSSL